MKTHPTVIECNLPSHLREDERKAQIFKELDEAIAKDELAQKYLAFPALWVEKEHQRWKEIDVTLYEKYDDRRRIKADIQKLHTQLGMLEALILRLQRKKNIRQPPITKNNRKYMRRELKLLKPIVQKHMKLVYEQYKTIQRSFRRRKEGINDADAGQILTHLQDAIQRCGGQDPRSVNRSEN